MQISHRGKYTFLFNAVTYVCRTVDVVVVRWDAGGGRAHFTLSYVVFLTHCFAFLTPLICLASPETSSLATWTGTTTLTASLWGECLTSKLPPLFLCRPTLSLPQITCCQLLNRVLDWLVMPASAIKDALLWRSQLHRRTVISFFFLVAVLFPPQAHKLLQIFLRRVAGWSKRRIYMGSLRIRAMRGLNLLRSCVFNSLSKSSANDAGSSGCK